MSTAREEEEIENDEDQENLNSSISQTPDGEPDKNKVGEMAVEIADLISEINNKE
jgi:hypothetical protein